MIKNYMKKYYKNKDFIMKIDNNKVYHTIINNYNKNKNDRKLLLSFVKSIKHIKEYEFHVFCYLLLKNSNGITEKIKHIFLSNEVSLIDIYLYLKSNIHFFISNNSLKEFDDKLNGATRLYCLETVNKDIYLVDRYLDSGGNSNIFICIRIHDWNQYILKYITRDQNDSFSKELKITKSLNHPNIIKIIDSSDINKPEMKFYITKLYGYSLHKYLFHRSIYSCFEDSNINSKINFMHKIIDALLYIQKQGLAHFDIKADNIFFDDINEPVLADFGCVVDLKNDKILKDVNTKLGNHPNASPEQRNFPYTKFKTLEFSDIYSTGIVFNQLVCGQSFEGMLDKEMYSSVKGELSYLAWITTNMIANNPSKRPSYDLVSKKLDLFKNIWNGKVNSTADLKFSTSLDIAYTHSIFLMKPANTETYDDYIKKFENPDDIDEKYADLLRSGGIKSEGLFEEWVSDDIRLVYKKSKLDKDTTIGQIFAIPTGNNTIIENSFCIKTFIINPTETEPVLFSIFDNTVVMYLNTSKSKFFHMFHISDILNYYNEGIVEHYFYHHERDLNKIYKSNNLFFKTMNLVDNKSLLFFGEKNNKQLLFFVSGNKVFKLPQSYLNF